MPWQSPGRDSFETARALGRLSRNRDLHHRSPSASPGAPGLGRTSSFARGVVPTASNSVVLGPRAEAITGGYDHPTANSASWRSVSLARGQVLLTHADRTVSRSPRRRAVPLPGRPPQARRHPAARASSAEDCGSGCLRNGPERRPIPAWCSRGAGQSGPPLEHELRLADLRGRQAGLSWSRSASTRPEQAGRTQRYGR